MYGLDCKGQRIDLCHTPKCGDLLANRLASGLGEPRGQKTYPIHMEPRVCQPNNAAFPRRTQADPTNPSSNKPMAKQEMPRVSTKRPQAEKLFYCPYLGCKRGFTNTSHFRRHERYHNGIKPYACTICRMGFSRRDYLDRHMKNINACRPQYLAVNDGRCLAPQNKNSIS